MELERIKDYRNQVKLTPHRDFLFTKNSRNRKRGSTRVHRIQVNYSYVTRHDSIFKMAYVWGEFKKTDPKAHSETRTTDRVRMIDHFRDAKHASASPFWLKQGNWYPCFMFKNDAEDQSSISWTLTQRWKWCTPLTELSNRIEWLDYVIIPYYIPLLFVVEDEFLSVKNIPNDSGFSLTKIRSPMITSFSVEYFGKNL